MVLSTPFSRKSTRPRSHVSCHFALDLLCYKERCSSLYDDTLGTIVHGIPYLVWHHCLHLLHRRAAEQSRLSFPTACRKGLCMRLGNGSQSSPTCGSRSCHLVHCPMRNCCRAPDHFDTRLRLFNNLMN